MFFKERLYIPFLLTKDRERFIPGLRKVCELVGTTFPRHSFPVDELGLERAQNVERIAKIIQADIPDDLKNSCAQILEGIDQMMERMGRLHDLGFTKSRILKILRKDGAIT